MTDTTIQPIRPSRITYSTSKVDMDNKEDGGDIDFTYDVDTNAENIYNPGGKQVVNLNGTNEKTVKMREALYYLLLERVKKGEVEVVRNGDKIIFKTKAETKDRKGKSYPAGTVLATFTLKGSNISSVEIPQELKGFRGFVDIVQGNVGSNTSKFNAANNRIGALPDEKSVPAEEVSKEIAPDVVTDFSPKGASSYSEYFGTAAGDKSISWPEAEAKGWTRAFFNLVAGTDGKISESEYESIKSTITLYAKTVGITYEQAEKLYVKAKGFSMENVAKLSEKKAELKTTIKEKFDSLKTSGASEGETFLKTINELGYTGRGRDVYREMEAYVKKYPTANFDQLFQHLFNCYAASKFSRHDNVQQDVFGIVGKGFVRTSSGKPHHLEPWLKGELKASGFSASSNRVGERRVANLKRRYEEKYPATFREDLYSGKFSESVQAYYAELQAMGASHAVLSELRSLTKRLITNKIGRDPDSLGGKILSPEQSGISIDSLVNKGDLSELDQVTAWVEDYVEYSIALDEESDKNALAFAHNYYNAVSSGLNSRLSGASAEDRKLYQSRIDEANARQAEIKTKLDGYQSVLADDTGVEEAKRHLAQGNISEALKIFNSLPKGSEKQALLGLEIFKYYFNKKDYGKAVSFLNSQMPKFNASWSEPTRETIKRELSSLKGEAGRSVKYEGGLYNQEPVREAIYKYLGGSGNTSGGGGPIKPPTLKKEGEEVIDNSLIPDADGGTVVVTEDAGESETAPK